MRSLAVRSLLSVALVAAFAPMPAAAQLNCNLGTLFNPIWVACQGSYTQITGETDEDLQAYLDYMQVKGNWKLYPTSPNLDKFEEAFGVVDTWGLSAYQDRTNFNTDGTPQNGAHGPFTGFEPNTQTLNFVSPYTGVFVVVLKGSTWFSMYLFNIDFAITSLQFDMRGTWAGGSGTALDALSHADLWGGTTSTVPEPSSMLLLASGLLGLGVVGYRRRRK